MANRTTTVGSRGTVVIPAEFREEGLLLRPATVLPLETYSRERKAEFLLTNATDEEDYRRAREAVVEMELVAEAPSDLLPDDLDLPEKDRPIVGAAIQAEATHLVTGDLSRFGPYLGRNVAGIRFVRPAELL